MLERWISSARARRGLALGAVLLATGGLVLARSPGGTQSISFGRAVGKNAATFSGPGASGSFALSHSRVRSSGSETVYAELRLKADADANRAEERAPLSLAIVFDSSGSMSGEKIETSKRSVISLIQQMQNDDEVAFVRYDSQPELVQPLARVGNVRSELIDRVQSMQAGGGTNIPPALEDGLRTLNSAREGRVRRVVLVSDGLDSRRTDSERLARDALDRTVTVSALGIGLDFDESYMSSVARSGRGNFGFVRDSSALASFLNRELKETAKTSIESASARINLPRGMRLVRAVGAEIGQNRQDQAELLLGSLFAGDERRVVVELAVSAEAGETLDLDTEVSWQRVGGERSLAKVGRLGLVGDPDEQAVAESRDESVYSSALSAMASLQQIRAAEAYARGDVGEAQRLIDDNRRQLSGAMATAPAPAKAALGKQLEENRFSDSQFRSAAPGSPKAKEAAKASTAINSENLSRNAFF